ncbi:inositol polyphosphate 5-phosphatase K [Galendromus occidentalis]|uniref:Inositol polyphosphate 5-phosphatase K n=1 Tax=Galendromus occidentalis TaxID=34638 RepID=A0AAJ6VV40_9ACAR|nr:inositol polyphosphate 5-phosphatase K [Galendromus occidentalis]
MSLRECRDLRIRVITYNVASTYPIEDLRELLGVKPPFELENLPNIYAIGLQEVSVKPANLVNQTIFEEPWITCLRSELKSLGYIKLISYKLQGLVLIIFVRRAELFHYRDITPSYVRTGLGGMWGNKGATVVSLKAFGNSICFVNSHLAAHDHGYYKRVQEYTDVLRSQTFEGEACNIIAHDYSFWFGDLNFRLNDVTLEQLKNAIQDDTIMAMFKHDQLTRAQRAGEAFEEFQEEEITFRPTFKFQQDTAYYKLTSRKPAWTDRILYRCTEEAYKSCRLSLKVDDYRSHESYLHSDHKPVSAIFTIKVFDAGLPKDKIYFYDLEDWSVNTGFGTWFCCDDSETPQRSDWIGLFQADFTSIDQYVGYIWVETQPADRPPMDGDETDFPVNRRTYYQSFCDQMFVPPGDYVLIYFRGTCDVLGISQSFKIVDSVGS